MLEEAFARAVSLLERERFPYMVIGGFALPSYGAIRSTVDIDIAVRIRTKKEFVSLEEGARRGGFEPQVASYDDPVNVFLDTKSGVEVELWLRPDGVVWDAELLRRRRRVKIGKTTAWVISPEDFVVSKLSRPDRGVQDEKDAKGVLARQGRDVDRKYLRKRAMGAGVLALLEAIENAK